MLRSLHRSLTKEVLKEFGYSKHTQKIVGETVCWPDWYRWEACAPHAETPHQENGQPLDPAQASLETVKALRTYLNRIETTNPNERLVWLGFALHLVQDIATHEGMTNPEHSMRVFLVWSNPDYSRKSYQGGYRYSRRFMKEIEQRFDPDLLADLKSGKEARLLTQQERKQLLGKPDITIVFLLDFIRTAFIYLKLKNPKKRVRWDVDNVLRLGLQKTDQDLGESG
ncbi:MAG: hypothetical protein V1853_04515 [bacterium]